jgi:serine/threonine protein kinase
LDDLTGKSLGRYHIIEHLGEGGMADVYKAFDTQLERDVAIKVIRKDTFLPSTQERMLKRFEREAKSQAKMSHPNIVKVFDFGVFKKAPYLVMEYLPGGTLKDHMGQPMPWAAAAALLVPVAHALEYAHAQGVLHRDVKPANILITAQGQPMLTDFGIAKLLEDDGGHTLTGTGVGIGTPEYMAPEQGLGNEVDGRADVYALGVVLYELVTGRKPYSASTPMAVLLKQINDPLPRPRDLIPDLPEQMERIIFKALAKNPEDRYADMGQFVNALERYKEVKDRPKKEPVEKSESVKAEPRVQETTFESVIKDAEVEKPNDEVPPKRQLSIGWFLAGIGIVGLLIPFSYALIKNYSSPSPTVTLTTPPDKSVYATVSPEISPPVPTQTKSATLTIPALIPSITSTIPATATTIPSPTNTTAPEKNENGAGNSNNTGLASIQGDWIYYRNDTDKGSIYRINRDGTKKEKLNNDNSYYINASGDWVFYRNDSDGGKLYRVPIEGGKPEKLNDDVSAYITVAGDWIYYQNHSNGDNIYRLPKVGGKPTKINNDPSSYINANGNWVYYMNVSDGQKIYRMLLDGSGREKLNDDFCSQITISDEKVYFFSRNLKYDASYNSTYTASTNLNSMNLDGSGKKVITSTRYGSMDGFANIIGDWIFFIPDIDSFSDFETKNHKIGGLMYRMNQSGIREKISEIGCSYINIVGDWIYFKKGGPGGKIYRMHLDGSGQEPIS